jgi:sigma-B regulation protein RsbU (phosphoserine phosphatase)
VTRPGAGVRGATTTTLPADPRSPALARRHVTAVARAAGLDDLLDEALLLVSELVTNAVLHAGSQVDLRLDTSGTGLRVEVVDSTPGAVPLTPRGSSDTREGGRGLYLLDALAHTWGTTHTPTGKSVWFLLGSQPATAPAAEAAQPEQAPPPRSIRWLTGLPPDLERKLAPVQVCTELLHRLADAYELEQACLLVDADAGWTAYACTAGGVEDDVAEAVRRAAAGSTVVSLEIPDGLVVPLHSSGGVVGALLLQGGPELGDDDRAVARLVADRLGVVVRDERAATTQLRSRGSLALLAEASELFAGTLDVQLAVTLAAQLVVPRFAAWSALWTVTDHRPQLVAVAHRDETQTAPLRVGLSGEAGVGFVLQALKRMEQHRPVLLTGLDVPGAGGQGGADELLAVPLVVRRRLVGLLVMGREGSYADDDVGLLHDLGRRAAVAVDNARLYEERTSIARALQASLLPPALPVVQGIDLGARYAAAGEGNGAGQDVGGDFYDVFGLDGGGWAVAIGDVCGKGAEAAAITGLARDVLRLLVREGRPASEVFRRLNQAILELGERGRFCTAALATLHHDDEGRLRVRLSNAGHPPPVLVTAQGELRFVGRSGTLLGVMPEVDVPDDDLVLEVGDTLVFYTDGVTERRRGADMFGETMLLETLAEVVGQSADALAAHLATSVRGFGPDSARDDMAVLVVRCAPVAAPARVIEAGALRVT